MMARLLYSAQVERVLGLVAHHQSDGVDVEGAARAEVLHGQHRVARSRDVERHVGVGLRDAHRSPPWRVVAGNCRSAAMDYRAICRSNKAAALNLTICPMTSAGLDAARRVRGQPAVDRGPAARAHTPVER